MAENPASYKVSQLSTVDSQIRQLDTRAKTLGRAAEIRSTLLSIVFKLQTEPRVWGDPLYDTILPLEAPYFNGLSHH